MFRNESTKIPFSCRAVWYQAFPPPYEEGGQEGVKKGPLQRFIGRPPLNLPLREGET